MASISFGGLTGIDFGSLADALIDLERAPITQLETRRETLTSKRDMYDEILRSLSGVRSAAEALLSPKRVSTLKSPSSNENVLTAAPGASSTAATYQVYVDRLASSASVRSGFVDNSGISGSFGSIPPASTLLKDLGIDITAGTFSLNGVHYGVDPNTMTIQGLVDQINANTDIAASYSTSTGQIELKDNADWTIGSVNDTSNVLEQLGLLEATLIRSGSNRIRYSDKLTMGGLDPNEAMASQFSGLAAGSFVINGEVFNYDPATQSLNDVLMNINSRLSSTLVAYYDSASDGIVLNLKDTGAGTVYRSDLSGGFLERMGLLDSGGNSKAVITQGQDAQIRIAGVNGGNPITSASNTFEDVVDGVDITVKAVSSQPTTVTVEGGTGVLDKEDMKAKLQQFVTAYNSAMDLIHTRFTEKPLEKATSVTTRRVGLLRGDTMLGQIRSSLSRVITDVLGGFEADYNRLGNLGIALDKHNASTGTLTFDTTKFDKIWESDPEKAFDILFKDLDDDGKRDDGEVGVLPNLLDKLDTLIDSTLKDYGGVSMPQGILQQRKKTFQTEYDSLGKRIEEMEARLDLRAEVLRTQFLAAERAIQQLQGLQSSFTAYNSSQNFMNLGSG